MHPPPPALLEEGQQGTLLCWALAGRVRCVGGVEFWLEAGTSLPPPTPTDPDLRAVEP